MSPTRVTEILVYLIFNLCHLFYFITSCHQHRSRGTRACSPVPFLFVLFRPNWASTLQRIKAITKLTVNPLQSGYRSSNALNANLDAIEAALENTLSRDGTSPNQMSASLDMNSNRITNLAAPVSGSDAARLTDVLTVAPGTNVATFLGTPSSANLAAAVTDETGTGLLVFNTSPTLVTPVITGGSFTGGTDIAVADGGTGSSTAADARTALAVVGTAALAASDGTGALLVKAKRAEADSVARTLSAIYQDAPATPYDFGALEPVIGNDNTAALQKWLDSGPNLFLPEGVWKGTGLVIGDVGTPIGLRIKGEGPTRSILYSAATSGAVLAFDVSEPIQHIFLEDIGVKGAGSTGTLNGIDFGSTFSYSNQVIIRNVEGLELGGSIIKDGLNSIGESTFSLTLDNISGYSKDHAIYLGGGPAVVLIGGFIFGGGSEYLSNAGIRILQGNCILIGYNGPEKDWGAIFGATVAEDGVYKLCQPTLIGCSIENNRVGGVWSKTSGPISIGSKYVCRWANWVGIKTSPDVITNMGWIDNIDAAFPIVDRSGEPAASWSQGCPVHFGGDAAFPFHTVMNRTQVNFYDTNISTVTPVFPGSGIGKLGFATFGPIIPARTFASQLTATGTVRTDAFPLPAQINQVLTVAAGTGVRLPSAIVAGLGPIEIFNDSAEALKVWPDLSGDTIDATGAGLSVTLSAGARCSFRVIEGSKWRSTLLGGVCA